MNIAHITPILNVSSLPESFALFERLGWKKKWDWGEEDKTGRECLLKRCAFAGCHAFAAQQ